MGPHTLPRALLLQMQQCCKWGALALVSKCTSIQLLSTVYLVLFAMRVS